MTVSSKKLFILWLLVLFFATRSYSNDFERLAGKCPDFLIMTNVNSSLSPIEKVIHVFGIPVYALPGVEDKKLIHVSNILAQYLDNDENGRVDNKDVFKSLININAAIVMWKDESQLNILRKNGFNTFQNIGNDEVVPEWHEKRSEYPFDTSLEEVLHLITYAGYAKVYPEVFGENSKSQIGKRMDNARGGHFIELPEAYPGSAWYTYDDHECNYACMVSEYFYWALTSILGAQKQRREEIKGEWQLFTRELVYSRDNRMFRLLTDPRYKLPTKLPNGSYHVSNPTQNTTSSTGLRLQHGTFILKMGILLLLALL